MYFTPNLFTFRVNLTSNGFYLKRKQKKKQTNINKQKQRKRKQRSTTINKQTAT